MLHEQENEHGQVHGDINMVMAIEADTEKKMVTDI
jgi:hypothetical protein